MHHRRTTHVLSLALAVVGFALVHAPATAGPGPAATTCLGKAVTVVASATVTSGTEGDDVVAMTPLGWSTFDALGGNDTICLALGAPREGRDPWPPTGVLDAGAGDDVVVDLSSMHQGAMMVVGLGTGDDSFTGNGLSEDVYADSSPNAAAVSPPPDGQRDVISTGGGEDAVWSTAPAGSLNSDRITFQGGAAKVVYRGAMAPEGLLDVTATTSARLELPSPGLEAPVANGGLMVDNVARRATVGGVQVLTWTGQILSFQLGEHAGVPSGAPLSFTGSDADESVTVSGWPVGDVRLAGGDDALGVEAYNDAFVPRAADGGPGNDTSTVDTQCMTLTIEIAQSATCDGTKGSFAGFETVRASSDLGGSRVTLEGTRADDWLVANGDRVTVRGRGGSDQVLVDEGWTTRVLGGPGADRIAATGDDVVVRGQGGRDRITLLGSPGYQLFGGEPIEKRRQVALGGAGPDVLKGTTQKRPDRLVGHRGQDRADGRAGSRDFCLAEKVRRCERP